MVAVGGVVVGTPGGSGGVVVGIPGETGGAGGTAGPGPGDGGGGIGGTGGGTGGRIPEGVASANAPLAGFPDVSGAKFP